MTSRKSFRWFQAVAVSALILGASLPVTAAEMGLYAPRVSESAALIDPDAAFWDQALAATVSMLPQVVTTPRHPNAAIKELRVKAVHNGQWIAFRIEWNDKTKNDRLVVDEFGDQVAVEMPVRFKKDALPSPMMGNPGGRVDIWQWRAAFQHDLEQGEPQVRDLYPNAMVDTYPDQVLRATDARPYTGAVGLDNPISHPIRTPVLDQMAEGWGTLTVEPDSQDALGKGIWRDGVWRVVIAHPLVSAGESDINLRPGDESVAAFAVWDGGNREVGARKAWSNWVPLGLAK